MITLSKEVVRSINNGTITQEELSAIIINGFTAKNIADSLAEFMLDKKLESNPITLDEDDFNRIISLFRIKGQRIIEGQVVKETRGRKKVNW